MKRTKPIDQERRAALCRRILQGDHHAVLLLAELYQRAGYKTLAKVLRNSDGTIHAKAVLG